MSFDELYQEIILDHYRKPRNLCRGDEEKTCVKHENPLCGDQLWLHVELDQEGRIGNVCFKAQGCSISQASASMMTESVKGLKKEEVLELVETVRRLMHGEKTGKDLGDIEALEGVASFPVRVKCALLAWMALKESLLSQKPAVKLEADHELSNTNT
jgi:nitrogen fixation NifU-like protein